MCHFSVMCVTLMVFVCVTLYTVYTWVLAMVYGQAPYKEFWLIMWLSIVPLVLLLEKPKYVSHSCICVPLHSWIDPLWEEKVSEWKSLQSPKVSGDSSGQYSLQCLSNYPLYRFIQGCQLMCFQHVCDKWNPFYVASLLQLRAVSWKKNRSDDIT